MSNIKIRFISSVYINKMLVVDNIKKYLIKYLFFISLFLFLQLNSGYAQGGIS